MNGHTSVMSLPLPRRVRSALYKAGIETLNQLLCCSDYQLIRIRGVGRWARRNVRDFLTDNGLELGRPLPVSSLRKVSNKKLVGIVSSWESLKTQSAAPDSVCMASELLEFRRASR